MNPKLPRRYHSGGMTGTGSAAMAAALNIDPGSKGLSLLIRVQGDAVLEATARGVALALIREFGVTLPLKAFRKQARPLPRLEAMVLAKLEGVAVHLGTP